MKSCDGRWRIPVPAPRDRHAAMNGRVLAGRCCCRRSRWSSVPRRVRRAPERLRRDLVAEPSVSEPIRYACGLITVPGPTVTSPSMTTYGPTRTSAGDSSAETPRWDESHQNEGGPWRSPFRGRAFWHEINPSWATGSLTNLHRPDSLKERVGLKRITGRETGKSDECSTARLATDRRSRIIVRVRDAYSSRFGNGRWLSLLARPRLDPADRRAATEFLPGLRGHCRHGRRPDRRREGPSAGLRDGGPTRSSGPRRQGRDSSSRSVPLHRSRGRLADRDACRPKRSSIRPPATMSRSPP